MTYENAYEILSDVRRGINAYSTAYVQGTDTTSAFSNAEIMKHINRAQWWLFNMMLLNDPQLFFKSTSLTPSSNTLTMPSDFFRLRRLENASKYEIFKETLDEKVVENEAGTGRHFYWKGGQIILDDVSYTEAVTLYYISRPRELEMGVSSAGGALSVTLASTAKAVADYYNDIVIENITDGTVDTISDYTAARVATVANTWASSKYYGTVSELPVHIHHLIASRALLTMKATYKSLEKPSVADFQLFREEFSEAFRGLFGTVDTGNPISEMFL